MKQEGTIWITLDGATFEDTERCRKIIHLLFEQGIFDVKRGDVILSFDEKGNLGRIKLDIVKWLRQYGDVPRLQEIRKSAIIEIVNPTLAWEFKQRLKEEII